MKITQYKCNLCNKVHEHMNSIVTESEGPYDYKFRCREEGSSHICRQCTARLQSTFGATPEPYWSTERPTEEGFYPACAMGGKPTIVIATRAVHGWVACQLELHGAAGSFAVSQLSMFEWWGSKIEFPPLPEEAK